MDDPRCARIGTVQYMYMYLTEGVISNYEPQLNHQDFNPVDFFENSQRWYLTKVDHLASSTDHIKNIFFSKDNNNNNNVNNK